MLLDRSSHSISPSCRIYSPFFFHWNSIGQPDSLVMAQHTFSDDCCLAPAEDVSINGPSYSKMCYPSEYWRAVYVAIAWTDLLKQTTLPCILQWWSLPSATEMILGSPPLLLNLSLPVMILLIAVVIPPLVCPALVRLHCFIFCNVLSAYWRLPVPPKFHLMLLPPCYGDYSFYFLLMGVSSSQASLYLLEPMPQWSALFWPDSYKLDGDLILYILLLLFFYMLFPFWFTSISFIKSSFQVYVSLFIIYDLFG